jgi:hypothetical protein
VDAAVEAEGFAEEDGGRGVAVGDGLDVHGHRISQDIDKHKLEMHITWVHRINETNAEPDESR